VRFDLRWLFGLVTCVAVAAAMAAWASRSPFGALVAQNLAMLGAAMVITTAPLCLGTLALYCRGYKQTFFLGALLGSLAPWLADRTPPWGSWLALAVTLAVNLLGALACGALAVATRRFAERRGWHRPPSEGPPGLSK
jgi:hypothetical protein